MAWIMNNSAGASVERRNEPYLDQGMKDDIEARLIPRYPTRRAALLPVLHMLQDRYGYLAYQAIEEVAAFLGIAPSEAADTASFYEMYFLAPKGRYVIWVCQSISCELMGHHALMQALERKLGITAGQTTDDGRFTLMHAECLGSCGTAPVALVNDVLHENLTVENLDKVLDALE